MQNCGPYAARGCSGSSMCTPTSHTMDPGNETVDKLAKEAATEAYFAHNAQSVLAWASRVFLQECTFSPDSGRSSGSDGQGVLGQELGDG